MISFTAAAAVQYLQEWQALQEVRKYIPPMPPTVELPQVPDFVELSHVAEAALLA